MAAGEITFIQCPKGDSFPVQKTASRSSGIQQVVCPRCGHGFEVKLEETVERLSQDLNRALAMRLA
jgi:transposase-like protein